jgi:hypothetical protein
MLFVCGALYAQSKETKTSQDSGYVLSYRDKLNISTGLQTNNLEFIVAYPASNLRFELSPRETLQQFILFQYKWINFRYSFTPSYLNPDKSLIKGNNTRTSFDLVMAAGDVDISLMLQNAKGYYVKNMDELDLTWKPGDPHWQLNNLSTKVAGLEFAYNVNKRFSDIGMISGKSKQLKNAWSLIPALSVYYMHMSDPSIGLAAGTHADDYNVDINFRLPLAATFVWSKNWSLAGTAGPITGVNFFHTESVDTRFTRISNKETRWSTGFYLQGGLSYTKEKWYAGLDANLHQYGSGDNNSRTRRLFYGVELYIGKRFTAPKLLQRIF